MSLDFLAEMSFGAPFLRGGELWMLVRSMPRGFALAVRMGEEPPGVVLVVGPTREEFDAAEEHPTVVAMRAKRETTKE